MIQFHVSSKGSWHQNWQDSYVRWVTGMEDCCFATFAVRSFSHSQALLCWTDCGRNNIGQPFSLRWLGERSGSSLASGSICFLPRVCQSPVLPTLQRLPPDQFLTSAGWFPCGTSRDCSTGCIGTARVLQFRRAVGILRDPNGPWARFDSRSRAATTVSQQLGRQGSFSTP